MPFARLDQIKINPRQRSEMNQGKIDELKEDIKTYGLLHPIIIDSNFNLIAGGRRLRAVTELAEEGTAISHVGVAIPLGEIICGVFQRELSEIEKKEIELNENLLRENLSWQDETRALAEIHALRKLNNPSQTFAETSKEVLAKTNSDANPVALSAKISRATITNQFLDHPDVKNAANEKLAFNAAARLIRNEFTSQLAEIEAESPSAHQLLEGDATSLLPSLDGSYRCFILDPPYGVGADKFGDAAQGRHGYDDSPDSARELNRLLIKACTAKATSDAHLWLFCDIDLVEDLKFFLAANDWNVFRTPLVWNSGTSGHVPNQKLGIRRNYELILFAYRDSDRGLAQVLDDVIRINQKSGAGDAHGAAKPVELYELLLRMSALPGDHVLDPTCGSGTIFRAADKLGMKATGIELDPKQAENCRGLIRELENDG